MLFKPEKKPLRCFEKEVRNGKFYSRVDRGMQTVEIKKIVGSVSRCLDFDREFSLKGKKDSQHLRTRLEKIKEALRKGVFLPVVELYKVGDDYYVVDGHHRIAAARELGQRYIDAHVIEYLPSSDNLQAHLIRKKSEFEIKTGIQGIKLSQPEDYDKLIAQIEEYKNLIAQKSGEKISFKEAARKWYRLFYHPIISNIEKLELKKYFPNATVDDIYVYLCEQVRINNRKNERYNISLEEALKELGILARATKLIFSDEKLKEKILKMFMPCYYLKRCPFGLQEHLNF